MALLVLLAATAVARVIAPWLGRLGAEILVVGGNIANALPLFEPGFQEGLSQAGVSVRIAPSWLLETAALLGSARLLDDVFWGKVAEHLPAI